MCGLDGVMYEEGWTMVYIYVLEGGYDIKRINQYRMRKGERVCLSCWASSLSFCLLLKAENNTRVRFTVWEMVSQSGKRFSRTFRCKNILLSEKRRKGRKTVLRLRYLLNSTWYTSWCLPLPTRLKSNIRASRCNYCYLVGDVAINVGELKRGDQMHKANCGRTIKQFNPDK